MSNLTISASVDSLVSCADAAAMRTVLGLGSAATSTLLTLLSDLGYTASTRTLASASTGASVVLPNADGTNSGLMAPADYTKLNTVTTKRVVGRNTASTGATEEVTADQLLDWIGTAAQGDLLYRGSSAYARLAAPASNNILRYNGSGSVPAWSSQWTLDSAGSLACASGTLTASTPALAITQTWNNVATTFKALTMTITDTTSAAGSLPIHVLGGVSGTTSLWKLDKTGSQWVPSLSNMYIGTTSSIQWVEPGSGASNFFGDTRFNTTAKFAIGAGVVMASGAYVAWSDGSEYSGTPDLKLYRDAANALAQRNGTTAQSLAVYTTYTAGTPDYERVRIYGTAASSFTIAAERSGTGLSRSLMFATGGLNTLQLDTNGNVFTARPASTNMTNGFFYIPTASGQPTGAPTAISGRVPMYYDSTANVFYIYNGAWKSVALV